MQVLRVQELPRQVVVVLLLLLQMLLLLLLRQLQLVR